MKIHAIPENQPHRTADSSDQEYANFVRDLRQLSARYGFKLVSVGGIQMLDAGDDSTVIAVWTQEGIGNG